VISLRTGLFLTVSSEEDELAAVVLDIFQLILRLEARSWRVACDALLTFVFFKSLLFLFCLLIFWKFRLLMPGQDCVQGGVRTSVCLKIVFVFVFYVVKESP
jgi:hypothetical protein